AGAAMASGFLIALEPAAQRVSGVDRELLLPLVRASVETWAAEGAVALTGPIARGDETTIARHREAIAERAPDLLELYDVLTDVTREVGAAGGPAAPSRSCARRCAPRAAPGASSASCRRWARCTRGT